MIDPNLIWLAEITAGVPGSPTERILRVASPPGYNHASAPGYYAPDIIDAANIKRNIVAPRRTFGPSEIGAGEVKVQNTNGIYDDWFDYGYGFTARIFLCLPTDDYTTLQPVITGQIEQPSGNKDEIIFRFKDRQVELDKLFSPEAYLGTNSGVTGTEGNASDIKGQAKIRIFGEPLNVTPDAVNSNDRLYGLNHTKAGALAPVVSITQRMNGSPWTLRNNYASLALLQAATPPQGNYDTALTLGLHRLGGTAPGTGGAITCDVVESATPATNQISSVIKRLLLDAGVALSDIDMQVDVGSPSTAAWYVGMVVKGETYRAALDMLCGGSAIWYCPNRLGVYQVRKFQAPGTPVAGFKKFDYPNIAGANDYQIKSLEKVISKDDGSGIPAWRIKVNYAKNWTVQDKDALASGLSDTVKEHYSREWLSHTVENSSIRDQFPEAVELEFNTLLTREVDAIQLATHLMTLYGVPRQMYKLTAAYNAPLAQAIDLGDTVTITYNRYGLGAGKNTVIVGLRYNAKKYEIEADLWG